MILNLLAAAFFATFAWSIIALFLNGGFWNE